MMYYALARLAKEQGLDEVSKEFMAIGNEEAFHSGFYAVLKGAYPQDFWNLVRSLQKVEAAGEEKIKAISDEFRAAGLSEAADEMAVFARQEGGHGFRLEALINRFAPEETSVEGRKVYRCPVCGYEYVGDLESEPDDYVCPLCGQPKKPLSLKIGKVNRGNLIRKKSLTVFRLRAAHGSYRTRIKRFFVKFWGAKVSMHSWRGHALNTVRVLFRCVC
ncbi:MAG: rubrerythrin [Acidaminococcus intestini]